MTTFNRLNNLIWFKSFPHSSVGKEFACSAGDPGSIPGSGRSSGEGNGNPFQYSKAKFARYSRLWDMPIIGVYWAFHLFQSKRKTYIHYQKEILAKRKWGMVQLASIPCDLKGRLLISPTIRLLDITCHRICVFEGISENMSS